MKLLIRIPDWMREDAPSADLLAHALFQKASDAYNGHTTDTEAYLRPIPDGESPSSYLKLIDGTAKPDDIRTMAREMNDRICDRFTQALSELYHHTKKKPNGEPLWLSAPDTDIYALKKAAMALDNDFFTFAESGILIDEHDCLATRLSSEEIKAIALHPEQFASITVYAK